SDLEIGPEKLLVSTAVTIFPSAPGLISLSKAATAQPQPGRASLMIRSEPPVFLTTKVVSMTCPLATVPASLVSGAISILGAGTALAAGAAALAFGFSWARADPVRATSAASASPA